MNKAIFLSIWSVTVNFLICLFGPHSVSLIMLLILMAMDFIAGIYVAAVYGKSNKSETGGLSSRACIEGIGRKVFYLFFVIIGNILDVVANTDFVRNFVVVALITNEVLSIIENAALAGAYVPEIIKKALDIINKEDKNK